MTFAPARLVALGQYLVANDVVNLGIVGDTAHQSGGVSYHLGADDLLATAYSRQLPRDKAGLTNAASAIDIGQFSGSLAGLRTFSLWLVARASAGEAPDIREIIYSPDGKVVRRWDNSTRTSYVGGDGTGQGDNSHLYHTHISFYRDSEARDKIALIGRYFGAAGPTEADVNLNRIVAQEWTANGTDGVLRAVPTRTAPISYRIPAGGSVTSVAEYFDTAGNSWRVIEYPAASGTAQWFLRTGPGVAKDHDFIAGAFVTPVDAAAVAAAAVAAFKAKVQAL